MQLLFPLLFLSFFSPNVAAAQMPAPQPVIRLATTSLPSMMSASSTAEYIAGRAKSAGLDVGMVLTVASKESNFNPKAIGDDGQSRGVFQISKIWHTEVSDACAYDLKCAADWTMKTMTADGGCKQWSTCPTKI